MKKGIVVRLYPTKEQEILISKTFGCVRLIYNTLLDYAKENKEYNRFNLQKLITTFRKYKPFLDEVDKFALQNACKNLSNGFINYFKKRACFPIYKSKKKSKKTYQTNMTNGNIAFNNGCIKLPKLGLVKCSDNYRDSNNKIINVTVSQNPDGKYYASVIYETNILPLPKTGKEVGIDLGTRKLITTSEGEKYHLPEYIHLLTNLSALPTHCTKVRYLYFDDILLSIIFCGVAITKSSFLMSNVVLGFSAIIEFSN